MMNKHQRSTATIVAEDMVKRLKDVQIGMAQLHGPNSLEHLYFIGTVLKLLLAKADEELDSDKPRDIEYYNKNRGVINAISDGLTKDWLIRCSDKRMADGKRLLRESNRGDIAIPTSEKESLVDLVEKGHQYEDLVAAYDVFSKICDKTAIKKSGESRGWDEKSISDIELYGIALYYVLRAPNREKAVEGSGLFKTIDIFVKHNYKYPYFSYNGDGLAPMFVSNKATRLRAAWEDCGGILYVGNMKDCLEAGCGYEALIAYIKRGKSYHPSDKYSKRFVSVVSPKNWQRPYMSNKLSDHQIRALKSLMLKE